MVVSVIVYWVPFLPVWEARILSALEERFPPKSQLKRLQRRGPIFGEQGEQYARGARSKLRTILASLYWVLHNTMTVKQAL